MPRNGGGVYDKGSATGGKVQGLPKGMDPKPTPSKSPTGRPGVGGNPLGSSPESAAQAGLNDAKQNDRS